MAKVTAMRKRITNESEIVISEEQNEPGDN